MASSEINRLMENLRMNLPGALDGPIRYELFNVLDSFLTETGVWTYDDEFELIVDETEYSISGTSASRIVRLLYLADANLTRQIPANMAVPGNLVLRDAPKAEEDVIARVCLSVLDPVNAEGYPVIPDWLVKRYAECFKHGVLGNMMSMIAKPWTNERMAVYHRRTYRNLMNVARVDGRKMNVFAAQSWAYPRGFA